MPTYCFWSIRSLLLLIGFVVGFLIGTAPSGFAGEPAGAEGQIEALIAGLSDVDPATRKKSKDALITKGSEVYGRLEQELEKVGTDFSARLAMRGILNAIPKTEVEAALFRGTQVHLDLHDATLAQALQALTKQTKVSFSGFLQKHAGNRRRRDFQYDGHFWGAMRKIGQEYGIALGTAETAATGPGPMANGRPVPQAEAEPEEGSAAEAAMINEQDLIEPDEVQRRNGNREGNAFDFGQEPVAFAGPFCVRVTEIIFRRNTATQYEMVELNLVEDLEPMLRTSQSNLVIESVMMNGEVVKLTPDNNDRYNRGRNMRSFKFPCPKGGLKSWSVSGTVVARISDLQGRKEVDLAKTMGKSFSLQGRDVLLTQGECDLNRILNPKEGVDRDQGNARGATLGLIMPFLLTDSENYQEVQTQLQCGLRFENEKHGRVGFELAYSNNSQANFNGRSWNYWACGYRLPPEAKTLVVRYSLAARNVTLPFCFENLPLPAPAP